MPGADDPVRARRIANGIKILFPALTALSLLIYGLFNSDLAIIATAGGVLGLPALLAGKPAA